MKKKGWAGFLRRKQYVIAGALVIIAAVATTVVYSNEQEAKRQEMEAKLAQEMQPKEQDLAVVEEETEEAAEASSVIPPKATENTQQTQDTETAVIENETQIQETESEETTKRTGVQSQTLHFAPEDGILWPMEGNVILNYSMDATVYFATLDQYKYNPAVIIAGEVNNKVYSVAKGKISSISNNEVTGCTVTVDLGDGYQAIYGQLKELNFKEGDYVEAGHVLGYINEPTKYFSVEGSNLYFEMQKDGTAINPIEFFE